VAGSKEFRSTVAATFSTGVGRRHEAVLLVVNNSMIPLLRKTRRGKGGGLGISGDTACVDHAAAWTMKVLAAGMKQNGRL
jgi:hypothetical protein